jgi:tetratricopeptide (TPR) repeat protein
MSSTLPFANQGLIDLAGIWEKELAAARTPEERASLRQRLQQLYLQIINNEPDAAVRTNFGDRLLSLHETAPLGAAVLESVAEITNDQGDTDIHRRVLEILSRHDDVKVRTRALERLGDLFDRLGNRRAAVESWKPAAQMRETATGEHARARILYERVLDTLPTDREAAERLVRLYFDADDWQRIPEVLGVVLRAGGDRGGELLLGMEKRAMEVGAVDAFVTMVDEAVAVRTSSSAKVRDLRRAKARALAHDPSRHAEASAAYRALLEDFGSDDERRTYESFIKSRPDAAAQHWERRWLFEWRAKHEKDPARALIEWGQAEVERGDREEAAAVYRRALDVAPEAERPSVALDLARILVQLRRPQEAVVCLAPLIAAAPPLEPARDLARSMLADPKSGALVAEQLESLANLAEEGAGARMFGFLVETRGIASTLREARRRWFRRAIELSDGDPPVSFATIVQGATELLDEIALWEAAERMGRARGELAVVARAYVQALAGDVDAKIAEALGLRMVALESEHTVDASIFVVALEKILELMPCARWALDRVKVAFGAQGRWGALFRLYDRAIEAAPDEEVRAELYDEAAFAARDLADDADRAIRYLARVHALRPDDASVSASLERLYEREGRTMDLIALLGQRAERAEAAARRELQRRIAVLWLELGNAGQACATLDSMLERGVPFAEVVDLVERAALHPGQARALERLRRHYEGEGKIKEAVRIAEAAVELADDHERTDRIRDLVRLRVLGDRGSPDMFARAAARIHDDVARDGAIGGPAYRALLLQAMSVLRSAPTDSELEDAACGASAAVEALRAMYVAAGDSKGAARLLARAARLPFDRARQRAFLQQAALSWSELAGGRARAIRLFSELFAEDATDEIAAAVRSRFGELLEAAGEHAKLARLLEREGEWERAGSSWEKGGDSERAVAAYDRAAAGGAEAAFEALARIHAADGRWKAAVVALEELARRSTPQNRARRVVLLAEAYVGLGRRVRARACLEEALGATPPIDDTRAVRARLMALYRHEGLWRPLAETLSAEVQATEDPRALAALLLEASFIRQSKLGEPEEAAALLEHALAADPSEAGIRPKLVDALEGLQQWERVIELLFEQIALFGEQRSKERALVHHRLARALARAGRAGDALAQLRIAAKMHPTHPVILRELGQLAHDAGDLDLAEKTYRALLLAIRHPSDHPEAGSSTQVFVDLGTIASQKGDPLRAANLLESALDTAIDNGEDPGPVERALRELGRHDVVARAVEQRVATAKGVEERAAALGELAELWREHLGREPELGARIRSSAEAVARELDQGEPAFGPAWAALWAVHASLGDEGALLDMVRRRVAAMRRAGASDAGRAKTWLLEAASLCARAEDFELAAKAYIALFEEDPRNPDVWAAVESVFERLGRRDRLEPLLESAIAKLDGGADRGRLRVALAKMRLEHPERVDEAIRLLWGALDDEPSASDATELLAGALEREERFGDLATLLERRFKTLGTKPSDDIEAAWRLGRALERCERRKDAALLYETLLDERPPGRETTRALAERLEALGSERLADCLEQLARLEPESVHTLVSRLVELRDAQWDEAALVRALELGHAADPADRAYLDRLLGIYEARGAGADVSRLLNGALAADPHDRDLLCARARERERSGDDSGAVLDLRSALDEAHAEQVVEILQRMVKRATPPAPDAYALDLAEALVRAGRPEQAERELDGLLARDPTHREALARAAVLATTSGAWDRAADAYARLVRAVEGSSPVDGAALSGAVLALADSSKRAGRPGDAREPLERALALLPEDVFISERLEKLCEAAGDWKRMASLLVARAEKRADVVERGRLLIRAAELLAEGSRDLAGALRLFELARAADPESIEAALGFARVEMALGRPRDAIPPLHDLIERARGRRFPLLAGAYFEMGRAHLALDELVEGLDALKAGFAVDYRHGELAMLLGLVAVDLGDEKTAERALLAVATLAPKKEGSTSSGGSTPTEKATALTHLASMAHARGDVGKARRWVVKALTEDRTHAGATALRDRLGA